MRKKDDKVGNKNGNKKGKGKGRQREKNRNRFAKSPYFGLIVHA